MGLIKKSYFAISAIFALLIAGCVHVTGPVDTLSLSFPFTLTGKMAVRYPQCDQYRGCEEKAVSASLTWDHRQYVDQVALYDPLGQQVLLILYQGDNVTVTDNKGSTTMPAADLGKRLGFSLPIREMQQWLMTKRLEESFTSQGWTVKLSRWNPEGFYQLLTLSQDQYFLRVFTSKVQMIK